MHTHSKLALLRFHCLDSSKTLPYRCVSNDPLCNSSGTSGKPPHRFKVEARSNSGAVLEFCLPGLLLPIEAMATL